MKRLFFTLVLLGASFLSTQAAETCSKSSPSYTVALLELYSSEGCSSCPPADKLIKQLYQVTGLNADQVIPLALHVDYWDYIGWRDPYAMAQHTERQRYLSALSGSHTIYTPEFFMSGRELRLGKLDLRKAVESINHQAAQASLQVQLDRIKSNQIIAQIDVSSTQDGELLVALVEQGLVSRVRAGENNGETLQHDAVVRQWSEPIQLAPGILSRNKLQLNIPADSVSTNLSVVAFVQNQQGKILQALSIPMCQRN